MQQKDDKSSGQIDAANEIAIPTRPLKLQLELLEKIPHRGTDVMSFKFTRSDASSSSSSSGQQQQQQKKHQHYLN
jgi:hypothetical protein